MRWRIVLILLLGLTLAGCGGPSGQGDGRTAVVAAFYPLAYAAARVAPTAEVANLTPAGAEPHDLELTPRDVAKIASADLVLYLGGGFMPAVEHAARDHGHALDLLDGVTLLDGSDPHVWLDPTRYAAIVRRIARALGDPAAADPLVADLERLDRDFRQGLAHCQRRELVTSHAAFAYLADAYGLRQLALTGSSPESEPGARAIARLVDEVQRSGATTVFFEPLVSSKLADTIAREAGVATAVLDPLEGLTKDAGGADYFSVMRANLAALRKALGCT